jgi:hypothetical protein
MRHFNFFENGGPFPSACLSCGNNAKLFDLGRELQNGGMAQLCLTCASELADFIGYTPAAPAKTEIAALKAEIVSRETELAKVPNQVEDLINGIRSSITDFIFVVSYSDDNNQHQTVSDPQPATDADSPEREAASRNPKAPSKPARK